MLTSAPCRSLSVTSHHNPFSNQAVELWPLWNIPSERGLRLSIKTPIEHRVLFPPPSNISLWAADASTADMSVSGIHRGVLRMYGEWILFFTQQSSTPPWWHFVVQNDWLSSSALLSGFYGETSVNRRAFSLSRLYWILPQQQKWTWIWFCSVKVMIVNNR